MEEKDYEQIIKEWKENNKELIEIGKCKKIFLDNLPRWENGTNIGKINWKASIGFKIHCIYNNIEDNIEIINYDKYMLIIIYKHEIFKLSTTQFSDCKLGRIFKTRTKEFKVKIGVNFKDEKRDIVVIKNEYRKIEQTDKKGRISTVNQKWYKYTCNVCGWTEGWMEESNLLKGNGCACCSSRIIVEGINDIPTTAPWMIPYFQGGIDEAKLYTKYSQQFLNFICPDCGKIKSKKFRIGRFYEEHSLGCSCYDNVPYSEKIMFSLLNKLKLDFEFHKNFNWSNRKEYDLYFELNNEQYIVETHGLQHYQDAWDKLEKTQLNDELKTQLALKNGIKEENYIVIDCRKSEMDWILNNQNGVLNSKLNKLFDLSKIDWSECEEFALSNLVKIACEYKKNNINLTTTNIGKIMGISVGTIKRWLIKGSKIGWCEYNTKQEKIKSAKKLSQYRNKITLIFKDAILLGVFESAKLISLSSLELFETKLKAELITRACRNKKQYNGYSFKYIADLTPEELVQMKQLQLNKITV